jgi:hypothetical protein
MNQPAFQYVLVIELADTTPVAYGPYMALGQAEIDLAKQTAAGAVVPLYPPLP